MKRKTFFKALAGLIITPGLLAKIKPKEQKGIFGGSRSGKTCTNWENYYSSIEIGKVDDPIVNLLTKKMKLTEQQLKDGLAKDVFGGY